MAKTTAPKDPLLDILQGVDMVGTMLHTDIPRVLEELNRIRTLVEASQVVPDSGPPASVAMSSGSDDATALLLEIRELLEAQDRRMAALEQRLARLAETLTA